MHLPGTLKELTPRHRELFDGHVDIARGMARRFCRKVTRNRDDCIEDATDAAMLGLLHAATRYDASGAGFRFPGFARRRIYYAMLRRLYENETGARDERQHRERDGVMLPMSSFGAVDGRPFQDSIADARRSGVDAVDARDEVDFLLSPLVQRDRQALLSHFLRGRPIGFLMAEFGASQYQINRILAGAKAEVRDFAARRKEPMA